MRGSDHGTWRSRRPWMAQREPPTVIDAFWTRTPVSPTACGECETYAGDRQPLSEIGTSTSLYGAEEWRGRRDEPSPFRHLAADQRRECLMGRPAGHADVLYLGAKKLIKPE